MESNFPSTEDVTLIKWVSKAKSKTWPSLENLSERQQNHQLVWTHWLLSDFLQTSGIEVTGKRWCWYSKIPINRAPIYRVPRFIGPNPLPQNFSSEISQDGGSLDHVPKLAITWTSHFKPLPLITPCYSLSPFALSTDPGAWYQSTMKSTGSTCTSELLHAHIHLHTKKAHDHHSDPKPYINVTKSSFLTYSA